MAIDGGLEAGCCLAALPSGPALAVEEQRLVEGPAHRLGVLNALLDCGPGSASVAVGQRQ